MPDTLLTFDGPGIQPYSARGLTQKITPIGQAASFRRDVRGDLVDLSLEQFKKYKMEITCTDVSSPAFDGVFPGFVIEIESAYEFSYKTAGGTPNRPVVTGSSRVDGDYTFYRPVFTMMVTGGPDQNFDEYGALCGWTIQLEEV